ncbi:hypothetical protein [Schleiferilactobacillus perolens]|jgi:translation initiation factor 2B subunit (eIF-2B alpha/beta/delta family)|uniref:Uncharacterized protein n=1 Tax=Schleiferilactobacillus perolens DSM 12744 TaxID=1423792 RepID=A0A0R1MUA8_9LACO|nr:hypothetical protein [Schleiferilactobacillus perolens]KRL11129.1 hypothetical protein FD09_GL000859 [Schleiferilactobacillus perolens DSM 12744]MCI1891507.1 hypothetical protein [Schleiferilactobacillus harbinensis]MCI1911923.1 hypothetical protein [Schleiferilactobacillus harbinensis]MCI2170503.1 hypothetical protein [Schleiferilactobacillus perolens]
MRHRIEVRLPDETEAALKQYLIDTKQTFAQYAARALRKQIADTLDNQDLTETVKHHTAGLPKPELRKRMGL